MVDSNTNGIVDDEGKQRNDAVSKEFSVEEFLNSLNLEQTDFQLEKYVPSPENIKSQGQFNTDASGYTKALLAKMLDKSLIDSYDFSTEYEEISGQNIVDLANNPMPLEIDEATGDIVYTLEENGEKKVVHIQNSIPNQKHQIAELIPAVPFDVRQNGVLEKSREAEAIYKVMVLNKIFSGVYQYRIRKVMSTYDIGKLEKNDSNFTDLLKEIIEDAPVEVRIILSACNIKLLDLRLKKEAMIYSYLKPEDSQGLISLKLQILQKRSEYKPIIDKTEGKAHKEVKRQELRAAEDELVSKSPQGTIYRIMKINSKYINARDYTLITQLADDLSKQIQMREADLVYDSDVAAIKRKIKQRCFREYVAEMKMALLKELYGISNADDIAAFSEKISLLSKKGE